MKIPVSFVAFLLFSTALYAQSAPTGNVNPIPEGVEKSPAASDTGTMESSPESEDASPAAAPGTDLESFLDGLVTAHLQADDMPGAIVAVVHGDRTIVKGYGLADTSTLRPVNDDALFRVGSISKTFIWTAAMMLVQEGKLDLDADINQYLDDMEIPPAFGKPITMNDLMAHRSGVEDSFGLYLEGPSGRSLTEALKRHMPERVNPPGAFSTYSNWGASLAAKVVEDVSGMPYEEFLYQRILLPLGMNASVLRDPEWTEENGVQVRGMDGKIDAELSARVARPHKKEDGLFEPQRFWPIGPFAPAGAMSISADDLATWMRMHLANGGELLDAETHAVMRKRAFTDGADTSGWAHGFTDVDRYGVNTYGHNGSTGNFLSAMTIVPPLDLGVFVSVNGGSYKIVNGVSAAVIKHLAEQAGGPHALRDPAQKISEADKAFAKKAAGAYLTNRRSTTRFEKLFAVQGIIKVTARDDGALVMTDPTGEATRLYPAGDGYYETREGSTVYFHVNEAGEVYRFGGAGTADKVTMLNGPDGFNLALGIAGFLTLSTLVGAWRRQGRDVRTTGMGRGLAALDLLAALIVIGFIGTLTTLITQMASVTILDLQAEWPPVMMLVLRALGLAVAGAAALVAVALVPVWGGSGWSVWRKLHHTLFVAGLLFLTWQLWNWNIIGAPMALGG